MRTKNQVFFIALHDAIAWEESFIDAMKGCKTPSDLEAIAYSEIKLADYKKWLRKLEDRTR